MLPAHPSQSQTTQKIPNVCKNHPKATGPSLCQLNPTNMGVPKMLLCTSNILRWSVMQRYCGDRSLIHEASLRPWQGGLAFSGSSLPSPLTHPCWGSDQPLRSWTCQSCLLFRSRAGRFWTDKSSWASGGAQKPSRWRYYTSCSKGGRGFF